MTDDKMITLPKAKLEAILDRLERVESAASKAGLAKYDGAHKKEERKVVKLMTYEGKVVLGWSDMVKNVVEKNPKTGHWEEDQQIEIHLEDETKEILPLVTFHRRYQKIFAWVVSAKLNEDPEKDGRYTFDVETYDGRKFTIKSKFVN